MFLEVKCRFNELAYLKQISRREDEHFQILTAKTKNEILWQWSLLLPNLIVIDVQRFYL